VSVQDHDPATAADEFAKGLVGSPETAEGAAQLAA
jgi:hypothetical protein